MSIYTTLSKANFGTDWEAARPTDGLIAYRRRRGRADGQIHTREQAELWASQQPWHGRVQMRRCDIRWWVWFVRP